MHELIEQRKRLWFGSLIVHWLSGERRGEGGEKLDQLFTALCPLMGLSL